MLVEPGGIENKLNALEKKLSGVVADLKNIKKRLAQLERGKKGHRENNGKVQEVQELDDQNCSIC